MNRFRKGNGRNRVGRLFPGPSISNTGRRGNRTLTLATGLVLAWMGTARGQPALATSSSSATRAAKQLPDAPGVTIHLLQSGLAVPVVVLGRAELVATNIFASIGVPVEWRTAEHPVGGEAEVTIEMQFDSGMPLKFQPGALAYAMPYGTGGTRIHVFSDRVLNAGHTMAGPFLGHVMAHEIAHVLQGISRHSAEGVMKEHWSIHDFYQMAFQPLQFTNDDVELIHAGLERRK